MRPHIDALSLNTSVHLTPQSSLLVLPLHPILDPGSESNLDGPNDPRRQPTHTHTHTPPSIPTKKMPPPPTPPPAPALDPPTFATAQLSLLAAELAAESARTLPLLAAHAPKRLAAAGLALTNLVLAGRRTGPGGRTVLVLEVDGAVGGGGGDGVGGVKLANEVTYKRMNWTMERLKKMEEGEYTTLTRVLFGLDAPTPVSPDEAKVEFLDQTLNDSQRDAVGFALASREVALIHGPPGTGKTYTLIELILQLVRRGLRILVCGPSNISVDNIVERLAPHKLPIIRLGHPARLLPSVLNHSLDVLTQTSEAAGIVKDVRKEMDAKQASIKKTRSGRERKAIYDDMKVLRKEYREREKQCVTTLVSGSKVVLATLHGAGGFQLRNEQFDVVIIDEASQALEAQSWIPLLTAKKVVLAGDHLQLPPTIKSLDHSLHPKPPKDNDKDQTKGGGGSLEVTLFDRLLTLHGPGIKRMLTTQYRMHEKIMRFPSDEMYDSQLLAAPAVATRLLTTLPYEVQDTDDTTEPLVFYDTQGGDFPEAISPSPPPPADDGRNPRKASLLPNDSKSNPSEALLVRRHVGRLVDAGVRAEDVAVVTPYNAQLAHLSRDLGLTERFPGLELGSVDGFQGREKEAVVVSLVRSNPAGEVGFLGERRRLNVAMTRPKRHLCVVGDGETVGKGSGFLARWMGHLEAEADLRYPDLADLQAL
ncbi:hypothetical protein HO173_008955 [Letharia columbiana]|uniref:DNA helicase n=1 Tax=Letharia columbiana TaxID=112416 RepID=A0A8H6FQB6_9LECA|nr:uncharacterized protein HO173_008955 [Letharia columbiana]KAF6232741.1 hypothetical protein HO173_008955 [Letharia columbiana]